MVGGARKAGASLVNDVSDAARAMLAAGRVVPPAAPLAGLAAVLLDPLEGFLYSPSLVTVASSSTVLPAPDLARNWGRGGGVRSVRSQATAKGTTGGDRMQARGTVARHKRLCLHCASVGGRTLS